jgi:hypothetical protein
VISQDAASNGVLRSFARRGFGTRPDERREDDRRLLAADLEQAQSSAIRVTAIGLPCSNELRTNVQASRENGLRRIQRFLHPAHVRRAHRRRQLRKNRRAEIPFATGMLRGFAYRPHQLGEQFLFHRHLSSCAGPTSAMHPTPTSVCFALPFIPLALDLFDHARELLFLIHS